MFFLTILMFYFRDLKKKCGLDLGLKFNLCANNLVIHLHACTLQIYTNKILCIFISWNNSSGHTFLFLPDPTPLHVYNNPTSTYCRHVYNYDDHFTLHGKFLDWQDSCSRLATKWSQFLRQNIGLVSNKSLYLLFLDV